MPSTIIIDGMNHSAASQPAAQSAATILPASPKSAIQQRTFRARSNVSSPIASTPVLHQAEISSRRAMLSRIIELEDQVRSLETQKHDLKEELDALEIENQSLFLKNEDLQKKANDIVAALCTIVDNH
ncbi:uncharacterized protein EI90DRAFT_3118221 [Cantharellus anzutake]|uniref:uncharacterized protein n=1 Tax=Cantharellus anzutake TaxID=1750568 RepID=UPI00190535F2|nr:uncharacterized protein EI90DRAFT_3118221 [Cantharellus anzutake]KAF8339138.1 hypothetical protein EI90DRAFT_3118221 [Cantharellus anzutake]